MSYQKILFLVLFFIPWVVQATPIELRSVDGELTVCMTIVRTPDGIHVTEMLTTYRDLPSVTYSVYDNGDNFQFVTDPISRVMLLFSTAIEDSEIFQSLSLASRIAIAQNLRRQLEQQWFNLEYHESITLEIYEYQLVLDARNPGSVTGTLVSRLFPNTFYYIYFDGIEFNPWPRRGPRPLPTMIQFESFLRRQQVYNPRTRRNDYLHESVVQGLVNAYLQVLRERRVRLPAVSVMVPVMVPVRRAVQGLSG